MQQDDIGAPISFILRTGEDPFVLPADTIVECWIRHPSGRVLRREFQITDPAQGEVYYETVAGDLAESGDYKFQARAVLANGQRVAFSPVNVRIAANLFPERVYALPSPAVLSLSAVSVQAG